MASDVTINDNGLQRQGAYLDVVRLDDERYCVQFIKYGAIPRTSYTWHVGDVVKQAQRAGNIPIRTNDAELRRMCQDQSVELI
ncbi:MAG: hypothetical protein ACJ8CR_34090 [Roseiflexaceae bacterium]|jgi:hypothetical protein